MEIGTSKFFGDANLVGYWKLNDVNDSKASYTLTNNNSVTFAVAKYGNGADLGSSNTNKNLVVSSDLGITNGPCSISAWVKLNTEIGSGYYYFVNKEDAGTLVNYQLRYNYNSGTRRLEFVRGRVNVQSDLVSHNITLGTSNFYHLVVTYDGTNVKGYVDGVYINQQASSGDGTSTGAVDELNIGSLRSSASYASAIIDDVAVWGRALTDAEVLQLYQTGTGALFFAQY